MTADRAKQIVDDMLRACQKAHSNEDELDLPQSIREDLVPWLNGPKDVRPLLVDLGMGVKPITGSVIYNLMSIAHMLCPTIAMMAEVNGTSLPEPDAAWIMEELS